LKANFRFGVGFRNNPFRNCFFVAK